MDCERTREVEMRGRKGQAGFSLVELMVAMVMTLMVSGAIFGLMTGGQDSFRREPEITDMQQNVRLAMDVIMRDVASAGDGLPSDAPFPFLQVFATGLDNTAASPLRPTEAGERADELEFLTGTSDCGPEPVCGYMGSASNIRINRNSTCVNAGGTPVFFMQDGTWTIREIDRSFGNNGGNGCDSGRKVDLGFRPNYGTTGVNVSPADLCNPAGIGTAGEGPGPCNPVFVMQTALVSYRIRVGADGVPQLERRSTDSLSGAFANGFQAVARGIEDMQVEYATAADPPNGNPVRWVPNAANPTGGAPVVVNNNYATIITGVRITLTGRTNANLRTAGEMADVRGQRAIRAVLTDTAAVRSGLLQASLEFASDPSGANKPKWH